VEEHSRTVTTFWRGAFEQDAELRREFLQLVRD
jgi:GTP cyclohydrolase I